MCALNTNTKLPAKQKSPPSWLYHQAVAERSSRYRVIEGFQLVGRITGFEMIARYNIPLKQEAIHLLREWALCPSHWTASGLFQTFEPSPGIASSAFPTHFSTNCLFILHLILQNLSDFSILMLSVTFVPLRLKILPSLELPPHRLVQNKNKKIKYNVLGLHIITSSFTHQLISGNLLTRPIPTVTP